MIHSTTKKSNAYISDMPGMYSGLAFIVKFCSPHEVTDGRVKVVCDNKNLSFYRLKRYKGYVNRKNMRTSSERYARCKRPFQCFWNSIT